MPKMQWAVVAVVELDRLAREIQHLGNTQWFQAKQAHSFRFASASPT